jgi:hypothetical protein
MPGRPKTTAGWSCPAQLRIMEWPTDSPSPAQFIHRRRSAAMSDETLIDFAAERERRIHDLHEKRLQDMRQAFEQVLPLTAKKKSKARGKPKKR